MSTGVKSKQPTSGNKKQVEKKSKSPIKNLNSVTGKNPVNNIGRSITPDKISSQPTQKKPSVKKQTYNSDEDEENNRTTSEIEEILIEDDRTNECNTTNVDNLIAKFNDFYNTTFLENCDDKQINDEAKNMLIELFKLQEEYTKTFGESNQYNLTLKKLVDKYNVKYRTQLKKNSKLKEAFEDLDIKNNNALNITREDNLRINELIKAEYTEKELFKKILNIKYDEKEYKDFLDTNRYLNEKCEKELLLKVFQNFSNKEGLLGKLSEKLQENAQKVANTLKDTINIENKGSIDILEKEEVNKIELKKVEESEHVRLNSKPEDSIDIALRTFLLDFYLKKKISQITFDKISTGVYQYGTQTINIKNDNGVLKVKLGNNYSDLDRFLELNANTEEYKIMKFNKKQDLKKLSVLGRKGSLN